MVSSTLLIPCFSSSHEKVGVDWSFVPHRFFEPSRCEEITKNERSRAWGEGVWTEPSSWVMRAKARAQVELTVVGHRRWLGCGGLRAGQ